MLTFIWEHTSVGLILIRIPDCYLKLNQAQIIIVIKNYFDVVNSNKVTMGQK